MDWIRNSPKLPMILGSAAGAVVAVSAGAWFGGVAPAQALAADQAAARLRLAEAKTTLKAAQQHLEATRLRAEALAKRAAEGAEPGELVHRNERLAGLLRLAEDAGLEVLRLDPAKPTLRKGHATVGIELEGVGPYAAHVHFLGEMEAASADLLVKGFRFHLRGDLQIAAGYQMDWIVTLPEADPAGISGAQR